MLSSLLSPARPVDDHFPFNRLITQVETTGLFSACPAPWTPGQAVQLTLLGPAEGLGGMGCAHKEGQTGEGFGRHVPTCGYHYHLRRLLLQTNTLYVAGVAVGNGFLEAWSALGIQARK